MRGRDTVTDYTRLSININSETEAALLRRKANGVSFTETLRRAVTLLDVLDREQQAGCLIRMVGSGPDRELVLLGGGVDR